VGAEGKPDDLLWTGTSYQEYQVWRSRYPGGLTDLEEAFGRSMTGWPGAGGGDGGRQ